MRHAQGFSHTLRALWAAAPGGLASLVVAFATLVLAGYLFWPVAGAWMQTSPKVEFAPLASADKDARFRKSDDALHAAEKRVDERSPFYPLKPKPVEPPRNLPRVYGGPALIAIYGDSAWFDDGQRIALHETNAESGVEIVELTPPWGAKVKWHGGDFTLDLFKRESAALSSTGAFAPSGLPTWNTAAIPSASPSMDSRTGQRPTGARADGSRRNRGLRDGSDRTGNPADRAAAPSSGRIPTLTGTTAPSAAGIAGGVERGGLIPPGNLPTPGQPAPEPAQPQEPPAQQPLEPGAPQGAPTAPPVEPSRAATPAQRAFDPSAPPANGQPVQPTPAQPDQPNPAGQPAQPGQANPGVHPAQPDQPAPAPTPAQPGQPTPVAPPAAAPRG
ncbi:hypothetical protein BH11PLA1_BH11PLA1_16960 [soil metagenome]